MLDQATHLRQLVMRANRQAVADHADPPRLVVISGGKAGVGATTLALNLAISLASHGSRTVLIDADFRRADIAALCGRNDSPGIGDVLAGRHDIHEVLQRAPGGIQLAAGTHLSVDKALGSEKALQRLLKQIRSLGPHSDVVVVDTGYGYEEITTRFWQASDEVLLVTTPDAVAVMDTYATVKTILAQTTGLIPLKLLVNLAESAAIAADVHRRIDQSCQRFLGLPLELAGAVPPADSPLETGKRTPLVLAQPEAAFALAIEQLAAAVMAEQASPQQAAA